MVIIYPIFIIGRDEWMYMFKNINELRGYIELIDVEEKEYTGWDINGLRLELFVDNEEIKIKQVDEELQLNKLKEAIFNFAKLSNTKVSFKYSGPENNLVELFNEAEKHIKKNTFREKLKHIFK